MNTPIANSGTSTVTWPAETSRRIPDSAESSRTLPVDLPVRPQAQDVRQRAVPREPRYEHRQTPVGGVGGEP